METKQSGWESRRDEVDGTFVFHLRLTEADATIMHADRLQLLRRAQAMIKTAFAEPTKPIPSKTYVESELTSAVRWVEEQMKENPVVTPWALFSHLEGRAG